MWGEKEAQELRNGNLLVGSFPPHWPALLARERYLSPTILTATAPQSTSGVIRIWAAAEVTDGVRGDIPLAEIPQGLCDQATGATRQREVPSRIPPEYDLAIAQAQSSRRTIRLVNQTGRHLGAETKLVGGHLG